MKRLKFAYQHCQAFVEQNELDALAPAVALAHEQLHEKKGGAGQQFLGWIDLPAEFDQAQIERIGEAAGRIQGDSEVFIVIGIGGSYLGARAATAMLSHSFYNFYPQLKGGRRRFSLWGGRQSAALTCRN